MTNKLLTLARVALIAVAMLGSAIVLLAGQARAEIVTFGGQTYDITLITGSYNNNQDAIRNSPWYSTENSPAAAAAAEAAILAYYNEVSTADVVFGYFADSTGLRAAYRNFDGTAGTANFGLNNGATWVTGTLASSAPASVPEINAGALSQVMLMLFALWLVTRGRRETETLA